MNDNTNGKNRILCISSMQTWGGGELFLFNLISHLTTYHFTIVSPKGEAYKRFGSLNARIIGINSLKKIYKKSGKWSLFGVLSIMLKMILSSFSLLKINAGSNFNLIISNGNYAALLVLPAVLLTRKKLMVVQHLIYDPGSLEAKLTSLISKYSTSLICVSEAVLNSIKSLVSTKYFKKLRVINNGINIPDLSKIKKVSNKNSINIGVVGSITREKGGDLILKAASGILKENKNVSLNFYGKPSASNEGDTFMQEIKLSGNSAGIEDRIHFHGFKSNINSIYENLDIIVSYSRVKEALSFAVIEAMAFEKIVIASDQGGPSNIINNGVTGILIKADDPDALEDKIRYCVENISSEQMNRIRKNARNTVETHFSLQRFRVEYEKLFSEILNKE